MFAVVLMGLGLVAVAALFPVAILQARTAADETAGAGVARNGAAYLSAVMTRANTADSGGAVQTLAARSPQLWDAVKGDLICQADPRYAWVPLYRRDGDDAAVAQVFLIVVRARNRPAYDPNIDLRVFDPGGAVPATLEPRGVRVEFARSAGEPDTVRPARADDPNDGALAEGAFLVIANGDRAGQVCRLGGRAAAAAGGPAWYLDPAYPLNDLVAGVDSATAFVVGRGTSDPANPAGGYSGAAQDVAVLSTFVALK